MRPTEQHSRRAAAWVGASGWASSEGANAGAPAPRRRGGRREGWGGWWWLAGASAPPPRAVADRGHPAYRPSRNLRTRASTRQLQLRLTRDALTPGCPARPGRLSPRPAPPPPHPHPPLRTWNVLTGIAFEPEIAAATRNAASVAEGAMRRGGGKQQVRGVGARGKVAAVRGGAQQGRAV